MKAECCCCFNQPGSHQQQDKLDPSCGNTYGSDSNGKFNSAFKITVSITVFSPQLETTIKNSAYCIYFIIHLQTAIVTFYNHSINVFIKL